MTQSPGDAGVTSRLRAWLAPLAGTLLFAASLWVLHRELHRFHYRDVATALAAVPPARILLAVLLVVLNYMVLTGYDQLAFVYAQRRIARWRIALASFVGYAISNNVGFALVSGTSARYRFYSRWGVDAKDLSRIVLFYSSTFWLGLAALGGFSLAFHPHPALGATTGRLVVRILGVALLVAVGAYLTLSFVRRAPVRVRGVDVSVPRPRLAFAQLALSVLDWGLAAAVLHALLPAGGPGYGPLLGAFLAAQLLGLVSHVPGGLGVFEGTMVLLLAPFLPAHEVLSTLLLFRVLYYLLPLAVALVIVTVDAARLRRAQLARIGIAVGGMTVQLAPRLLAVLTFAAGMILLFSGALPAQAERLRALERFVPLGIFEVSHFAGSILGVFLLVVAQGVARRLDIAWYLATAGLAAGIVASLLKGFDYEEALVLTVLLLAFLPTRATFDRKAAFFDTRFSPGWILAMIGAVGASIWLALFAFKHVQYAGALWWQFALDRDVSRTLRASVGATIALMAFGAARLLRPAPPDEAPPTDDDLAAAAAIVAQQPATLPLLVFLRDKSVVFSETRNAFLMYAVQGRSWIVLGDPVGPPGAAPGLLRAFLERVDDFAGQPVFYQVRPERLHLYADIGLTFAKLGEEARVPLETFTLEGGPNRGLRAQFNRLARDGATFRVLPAHDVPALLPNLRAVSDAWLAGKSTSEKGFSIGRFESDYLARFPIALLEHAGGIVAFASLLPGADRTELSLDLMRYRESELKSVMEGLFLHIMLWGRDSGYRWFNLGMAPLSGLDAAAPAPATMRLGHFVFRHGEAFYNFQGLRAWKEKFHPVWEPRYLAYPGNLSLPRILADVTTLVSGGFRRIFA